MFFVFQEIDSATNLLEKSKNYYHSFRKRFKYKNMPYYLSLSNKKIYVNANGDGVVYMSCEVVVLDKSKAKYVKAKLDISDAKRNSRFPRFQDMYNSEKPVFKDFIFRVWSDKDIITSVVEDYNILPSHLRREWQRSNKHICLKINLNSHSLEEKKKYKISYMFSVPGMFPIKDGYYDIKNSPNACIEEMGSSLALEDNCDTCKYSVYLSKDIHLVDILNSFAYKSGIDEPIIPNTESRDFGFYYKTTLNISNARKYKNTGFTWNVEQREEKQMEKSSLSKV